MRASIKELIKASSILEKIIALCSLAIMLAVFISGVNLACIVAVAFCCVVSLLVTIFTIVKKRSPRLMLCAYVIALAAVVLYFIFNGADAGFGAFTSGKAGFATAEHGLFTGRGNIFSRLLGNILLALPSVAMIVSLFCVNAKKREGTAKRVLAVVLSILLMGSSVFYVLTMNLRARPKTKRLWQGHDDYLNSIDKNAEGKPNVLFILMDDMGWGDISLNGAIYDTPNIDSIGREGLQLDNFYSSYSVCSPARFAALTGRYPYRGFADNVMYPTVQTLSPFASTRIFNSIEMGNNCDGMLGDEITIAEVLKSAGYNTGCFGKWHLGDYGEYLPTNQGFDYFYGSHHVNDMVPFYHAREQLGEYTIVHGTDELKDQSKATEWIHDEMTAWLENVIDNSPEPFFCTYTSPWPHAPVYAGDSFDGSSGMGTYVDCITEVDHYLGELFALLEEKGELEDTIIIFTSDNGPALEGSVANLRGGKYLAYEGGQKVPCLIRWDKGGLFEKGERRESSATLVDLFPTLVDLCSVEADMQKNPLPTDRVLDGLSMRPVLSSDLPIHTESCPILHMKREDIKAIQYTVTAESVLAREEYRDYKYPVLHENKYLTFKYFDRIQNDNSAFFDKYRKNWLHILTDDEGENYNRTPVYPEIAKEMNEKLQQIQRDFAENRRGVK